jgi:1-acyl-sn-glycerol-3-phosphate acyltransferase
MLCIQVDKENFSVDSFHEVVRLLKAGKVISIFPEGRVILGSEEIHTFKSGVVLMAYTAGAPILPVYIVPNRKWYNRRIAVIGDPIDIREMCGKRPSTADFDNISKYLQEKEVELKRYYHENYDKADKDIETNSNKKEEVLK